MSAASGVPSGQSARRTEAELKRALLAGADLPSGLVVVPGQPSGATVASADPRCAALVTIINAPAPLGSLQHVEERLAGGASGPFVDTSIDELGSVGEVAGEQAQIKDALASCGTVTVAQSGQPPAKVDYTSVPPPRVGQDPVALHAAVVGGGNAGFEFTQVTAGVDDTVVFLSFVNTPQDQIDNITHAAIDHAARVLAGTT